ncbi:uncharacterized protein LOC142556875 [Primulina tabacum]|uniref:uncharacterized protein LOC142556875 n=1 Tax=Primulina tabacum TaxID=48773 RepID=UPI003F59F6E5
MKDKETTCKIRKLKKLVEKDQFHEIQILRQMCCQSNENMTKDVGGGRIDVKLDERKNDDKNVSVEDFDTDLGGYNEVHHVDVVTDLSKCDDVGFTKLDMKLNKVRNEDSLREVVDERDDGNDVTSSQEDKVKIFISSIVKNVRTRTDRVKKRKPNMFVTPPSSTPRRKTKSNVECKEYRVISDEGDTSIEEEKISADNDESKIKNFRGRQDFCGCEEVFDKERNIIINYLTGEKLSGIVWEGERFKICGIELCDLLFGDALKDNIINCYMQMVSGYIGKNCSEIFCMDTTVQDEVLGALQRLNKKRNLKEDGYHDFFFLSHLTHDSREKLEQLNRKLIDRCRFLLFPIHANYHWFLLVYNTEKKEFEFINSIYTAMSLGTARAYEHIG